MYQIKKINTPEFLQKFPYKNNGLQLISLERLKEKKTNQPSRFNNTRFSGKINKNEHLNQNESENNREISRQTHTK